jgi:Zn-dependent M28 family amino/carboxypeptidase
VAAARYGALAVLVRSIGTGGHRLPHTGALRYADGVGKIPAAALAAEDAELLHRLLVAAGGAAVRLRLRLGAHYLPEVDSWNVVGDVPGQERPQEIVLLGAHLDAWDLGTGALDDGAGCGIVIDSARLLLQLGQPLRRTVRVVLFMNEELGLSGARAYAEQHRAELPRHVAALEADSGAGRPYGYRTAGDEQSRSLIERWVQPLLPLIPSQIVSTPEVGADLIPLQAAGVPVLAVEQDVSDYFDWHHTAGDTLDKVNPHDLALTTAAVANLAWAAADAAVRLPPSPPPPRR